MASREIHHQATKGAKKKDHQEAGLLVILVSW
jgi:hypothetical protein